MIVLKTFFRLLKRNLVDVILYVVIFLLISIWTAEAMTPPSETVGDVNAMTRMNVSIFVDDRDQSALSRALVDYLDTRFWIVDLPTTDDMAVREALLTENINAAVTIEPGMADHLLNGTSAVSYMIDPKVSQGWYVEQEIDQFTRFAAASLKTAGAVDVAAVERALQPVSRFVWVENPPDAALLQAQWLQIYFKFALYIIVTTVLLSSSKLMIEFKHNRVYWRTMISGFHPGRHRLQMLLGLLLLTVAIWGVFVIAPIVIAGRPYDSTSFGLYMGNLAMMAVNSLAFSYLIVSLTKNVEAVRAMANILPLGVAFISGVMVPQAYIGAFATTLAKMTPIYYAIRVINDVGDVARNFVIQAAFAVIYLLLALAFSRVRQRDAINMEPDTTQ
ncbi:MAG: ABC transporter permease [Saccharofermentanales bacterium]